MLKAIVDWWLQQEDQPAKKWSPDLPQIPDKEQRWFTPDEVRGIVAEASGQYKILFMLAAATGMRFGELAGLHTEDVDLERRTVTVRRSVWKGREVAPKTKAGYRDIPIDEATARVLGDFLPAAGLVFKTRIGTPLTDREVVGNTLHPICDKLKIKRGGMHAFRHGRVSVMRMNGVPEDLVKRQIGHSSLRTTSGYTHFDDTFQRSVADKLSWTQIGLDGRNETAVNPQRLNRMGVVGIKN
jgi:integrase